MKSNHAAFAVSTAFSAVLLLLAVTPADADEEREEPAGQATTCSDVLDGSSGHELALTTDPPEGAEVRAGDPIEVGMAWTADDFAEAPLYDVLACVTVDGVVDEALAVHEQDIPNRGEFAHRVLIPGMIRPGARVCVRGAVAGDGNGYFERNISDDVCFTMLEDQAPSDEHPAPPVDTPAAPPAPVPPPASPPAPIVGGITAEQPVPAAAPQPQERLPKTGPRHELPVALAGLLLAVGGALVALRPGGD